MKEIRDENRSIPIERLSKLSRYIFSRIYPEEYKDLLYEKKREFKLFQEEYEKKDTLESVINDLFLE